MKSLLIEICAGTSCHLLGAQDLLAAVAALPIKLRECLDLRELDCLNSCGKGPSVRINGMLIAETTPAYLIEMINDALDSMDIDFEA